MGSEILSMRHTVTCTVTKLPNAGKSFKNYVAEHVVTACFSLEALKNALWKVQFVIMLLLFKCTLMNWSSRTKSLLHLLLYLHSGIFCRNF